MSSKNPLAEMAAAEQALLGAVARATQVADEIGTGDLDMALSRFEASAGAAADRLNAAAARLGAMACGLLSHLVSFSSAVEADVNSNKPLLLAHKTDEETVKPADPSEPRNPSLASTPCPRRTARKSSKN